MGTFHSLDLVYCSVWMQLKMCHLQQLIAYIQYANVEIPYGDLYSSQEPVLAMGTGWLPHLSCMLIIQLVIQHPGNLATCVLHKTNHTVSSNTSQFQTFSSLRSWYFTMLFFIHIAKGYSILNVVGMKPEDFLTPLP